MKIAILSDLHIGASPDTYRRCCKVVSDITRRTGPGDTIIAILGDVTEHGTRAEFSLALDALGPLISRRYRFICIPGNHDYGPWGNVYSYDSHWAYDDFHERLCGRPARYPYVMDLGDSRLIGLDTCYVPGMAGRGFLGRIQAALTPARRFANGELGAGQLDALSAWLEEGVPTHILMHHHPLYHMPGLRLVDADRFWEVVTGRVESIHFGHRHRAGVYDTAGMRIRAHGSVGHQGGWGLFEGVL